MVFLLSQQSQQCSPFKSWKTLNGNLIKTFSPSLLTEDQYDQIGRNFAILATFYFSNFHLNKQFQHMVFVGIFRFQQLFGVHVLGFLIQL